MVEDGDTDKGTMKGAGELLHLRLDQVVPSNTNPRLNLEREPFEELKGSIEQNGLLQPIVVRPVNGKFEIIGGHRRFAAVSALADKHKGDPRFARIAAVVTTVPEALVPVLQLAENVNRADLSPLELADAISRAVTNGTHIDDLAKQLGWNKRSLYRYVQLHEAPAWLRDMAKEVRVAKKKLDAQGRVLIDEATHKPLTDVERFPGLPFTYIYELITLYNVLREHDRQQLDELGGDAFKPQAERLVRKLATQAAIDGWGTVRLRSEIKRIKDPPAKDTGDKPRERPALLVNARSITLHKDLVSKLASDDRSALAKELERALQAAGFKKAVIV